MPAEPSSDRIVRPAHDPIMGAFWIVLSMATLSGLTVCAKKLALEGMHPFQVVFFRNLFAALVFAPLLYYRGASLFETGQLGTYGWRCLVGLISMLCWFFALAKISIGEVTAISYLTPLFGTLWAIIFLGEKVRARRWTALAVGFIGALVILRPGFTPVSGGHWLALLSCVAAGFSAILVKQLTARDDPNKIVFLTHLFLVPMSIVPALFVWSTPTWAMLPLLIGMGISATAGHATLVRGYAMMDASLALIFEFAKLPFAAVVAWMFFAETIDGWTWIGALIIISSATYIAQREAALRKASGDSLHPNTSHSPAAQTVLAALPAARRTLERMSQSGAETLKHTAENVSELAKNTSKRSFIWSRLYLRPLLRRLLEHVKNRK